MQAVAPSQVRNFSRLLERSGVRPTRQREAIARQLFVADRHVTAEGLHAELQGQGVRVSLATVYNTLRQFKDAGLLRELAVDGTRTYFDTNTSNHNHFYVEAENCVQDIPGRQIRVDGLPQPPEGYEIAHVDVLVRLVPKKPRPEPQR